MATLVRGALAAVAICGLAGCSADLGGADIEGSGPPGGSADSAQPGRYSGLPEPCGAVNGDTLRELLPGGEAETYAGEPIVTFDTGRRVGCEWSSGTRTGTYHLSVDFWRVISYDADISDDTEAEAMFGERAAEAGVQVPGPDATEDAPAPPANSTAPRLLDDIGHAAFIDDRLTSTNPGERRDVTLAFRNANVIVTVEYTVTTTATDSPLDSAQLQQRTQNVARQLADGIDG